MAAITVNNKPIRHVLGDLVARTYDLSGATGTTLDVSQYGQRNIEIILVQQSTGAGVASAITSFAVSGTVITFTTGGGAMTHEIVQVKSRVG